MKHTKNMLKFILGITNAVGTSLDDGKLGMEDMSNFMVAAGHAGKAFEGVGEIPGEAGVATKEDWDKLTAYAMEEFDLPQEDIEEVIENTITLGVQIYNLIEKVRK